VPTSIVPLRPGPLKEPEQSTTPQPARIIGPPEIILAVIGAVLAVTAVAAGLPWLAIPAIASLGMGLGLPLQAALSHNIKTADGVPLDIGHESAQRLVTHYQQIAESRGHRATLVTAHRIVLEVADHLDGRPPSGPGDVDYVARRADAVAELGS
jgi:hypothetical protein